MPNRGLPPVELDDYAMFLLRTGQRDEFFEHITLLALNPDIPAIRNNPPHLYLQPLHVEWIYKHGADTVPFFTAAFDWERSWRPRSDQRRPTPMYLSQVQGLYMLIWDNLRYCIPKG